MHNGGVAVVRPARRRESSPLGTPQGDRQPTWTRARGGVPVPERLRIVKPGSVTGNHSLCNICVAPRLQLVTFRGSIAAPASKLIGL